MSDKENAEKENEQFSSSILYVATAVYVGVCAMVFGALYAKLPTFGEAFLLLVKDYGTILAGIPVLVAVVVAKQQLDANRRQHAASIRRSFKEQVDVMIAASDWCSSMLCMTFDEQLANRDPDVDGFNIGPFDDTYIDRATKVLAPGFVYSFQSLNGTIQSFHKHYLGTTTS
ncbi:hypothetical protein RI570_17445 [Brucella pseudogrignonensis]|uniref:hypothetical protein n=1 Tax=Brucella pseudogrignonensis TaxID=419475 RepID=UPI0028BA6FAC|nr:hypothetical protein [Brucella pseudogrignonensis]MDT6941890.1 hypothetical protein [Brucella pseudogrignonensis]